MALIERLSLDCFFCEEQFGWNKKSEGNIRAHLYAFQKGKPKWAKEESQNISFLIHILIGLYELLENFRNFWNVDLHGQRFFFFYFFPFSKPCCWQIVVGFPFIPSELFKTLMCILYITASICEIYHRICIPFFLCSLLFLWQLYLSLDWIWRRYFSFRNFFNDETFLLSRQESLIEVSPGEKKCPWNKMG